MKCSVILVTAIIFCQITGSPSARGRHRYLNRSPEQSTIIINPDDDPFIHPPWWQPRTRDEPRPLTHNGPYGSYEAFEISHEEFGENSSEEEEIARPAGPTRTPGYGGLMWWRPPLSGSSTTDINIPTQPSYPAGNKWEQIERCIKSCPVTSEFNPVCGSNDITYSNPGRLECEQRCGVAVELSKLSPCSSFEQPSEKPIYTEKESACIRSCRVTGEYNPVCGSNNVTYSNPGRLECAQRCGVAVELSKLSTCSSFEQLPEKPSNYSEEQSVCMRSCRVTGEYNPVCGSNNVTYSNPGRLECAQHCGVEVTLSKRNPCDDSELATNTDNSLTIGGFAAICMRSCPVTSEYNPVCGSNSVTYTNPGRLECAQTCGVAVTLVKNTSCEAPVTEENETATESNLMPTTNGMTARPYVNGNGDNNVNIGNNKTKENNSSENSEHKGDSNLYGGNTGNGSDQGKNNNENNSNTDGQSNVDGESKDNSEFKGRPGHGGNNHQSENEGNNGHHGNKDCKKITKTPPSLKEVMACMQTCSLTSESNPVCGTDSVTYMNPGRLLCAQFCGVDVKVKKFAPCASTSITNFHCPTTCTNPPVTVTPSSGPVTPPIPSIEACMEACPAALEFKPVCGTNNVTYRNLEKLQCARRCGIDVSLKKSTHCSAPDPIPDPKDNATLVLECIEHCSVPQKHEPICGSNNVTYNNTGHLICAKQCGLDIQVKYSHACSTVPDVPRPTTSTTTEKVVEPVHNGVNFTIDPAILANIWGTTSTTPVDDEDFELDQRVQDKQ